MATTPVVTRALYQPVIRLAVGVVILVLINAILKNVPMIQRLVIPGFPISTMSIISLIVGILMIVTFLNFRRDFGQRVHAAFPTFPEGGTIVRSGTSLGIVVVAFSMFDGVIMPFMRGFTWAYSLAFLLIGIIPLYGVVGTLYKSSNKITELLSGKMAEVTGELVRCPKCGESVMSTTKFCPKCGTALGIPGTRAAAASVVKCTKCGADNKSTDKFCSNCGKLLEEEEFRV